MLDLALFFTVANNDQRVFNQKWNTFRVFFNACTNYCLWKVSIPIHFSSSEITLHKYNVMLEIRVSSRESRTRLRSILLFLSREALSKSHLAPIHNRMPVRHSRARQNKYSVHFFFIHFVMFWFVFNINKQ